jgi:penicillin amidase
MRFIRYFAMGITFVLINGLHGCKSLNNYQTSGTLKLANLSQLVEVVRDEKGMAYIRAGNLDDALTAQGFVTAQDRLFQMEMIRRAAQGRISEVMGEKAKPFDIRMRTLGFYRNARKHAQMLDAESYQYFENYICGINAYITTRGKTHPLELKLTGIQPSPWVVADILSIIYYMSWGTSANLATEIIAQMLLEKVGPERVGELLPMNINPDDLPDGTGVAKTIKVPGKDHKKLSLSRIDSVFSSPYRLNIGSNNWVIGAALSASGKPIVANDPHLEATILPGPWYPCGLITPSFRAVGANIPGIPGLILFRNDHIAIGTTNAYGDIQDLYLETLDPENPKHYLEGDQSLPFEIIKEILVVKDKKAPDGFRKESIEIHLTRRGPVVSKVLPGLVTDQIITLRWSPFETMRPSLGFKKILTARSVADVRRALADTSVIALNFVFADTNDSIGWQVSGKLPIRSQKDGTFPFVVRDGCDNWTGWVPYDDMPQSYNPDKGWVGTCNHKTVNRAYPYYYSSHQASSYRYQRLKQLMNRSGKKTAADLWEFQRDTLNLMAKAIAPIMAKALTKPEETRRIGEILFQWDFQDDQSQAAPTIFQAIYRDFARRVFTDELGEVLTDTMLSNWYFWQERLQRMILDNNSSWFDDHSTVEVTETRDDLFYQAALNVAQDLSGRLGSKPEKWLWGKIHRIDYLNPIRQKGIGKGVLGGGSHPVSGSGETLRRNMYDFNRPFDVIISDSLRMVADLGDSEKVLAVLPGGVSGRTFHPHAKDQIDSFIKGEKEFWWFSDAAIRAHTETTLILVP